MATKTYKKTFSCLGCNKQLEVTIEPDKGFGLFFRPRSTKLSYTCPFEKVKQSLPIDLNTTEYPFKRGKIVNVVLLDGGIRS
ncbi:MAG: hypothetical protein WA941_01315 [Nitrososphaeraceae archaeon]